MSRRGGEMMAKSFRHEDIAAVPSGWKVRTVTTPSGHRVRVAFPPGRRKTGSGRLVSILHPNRGPNPCLNPCTLRSANPQELMVMSANNPPRSRRNAETKYEVVALGRWGGELRKTFDTREEAKQFAKASINLQQYFKPHIRKLRTNPASELLVMSANPHHGRRIIAGIGALERNPETGAEFAGEYEPTKEWILPVEATEEQAKMVAAKLEHEYPHGLFYMYQDPQANQAWVIRMAEPKRSANPRVEVYRTENPSAQAIAEVFSGRPLEFVDVDYEPHMPRARYAYLSKLVGLTIKPASGGQVMGIAWWNAPASAHDIEHYGGELRPLVGAPDLVAGESDKRLYLFKGVQNIESSLRSFGAQAIDGQVYELGEARVLRYRMKKSPIDDELMDYVHTFGEEGGARPRVLFDAEHKKILFDGGDYRIDGLWIKN
jgi:hypothetical protein